MTERHTFTIKDQSAQKVEAYATLQGIDTDYAAEILIVLGSYVINKLAEGRVFLLKSDDGIRTVEWNLPEAKAQPTPVSLPILRVVK